MILNKIKQDNIEALKARDTTKRSILSVVIGKIDTQFGITKTPTDVDVIGIIQKTIKELEEEKANFEKLNRAEDVTASIKQIEILKSYLPKMMSDDEIIKVIDSLEDKSMPSVMKHFKMNYTGKVDMGRVSAIARTR